MTNRREFLQISTTIAGAFILPKTVFATPSSNFHFVHADSCKHWTVTDPVQWSLKHAHEPILARAAEGLGKLTANDGERIIRLVVRRCGLNLIELQPERVVVHHWSSQRADIRPFFKQHGLARPQVEVVLRDRKKEVTTTKLGDEFLFGDQLAADFPLAIYLSKWQGRLVNQPDDWTPAPGTRSGFAWGAVEDNIPWIALKAAWRRTTPMPCLNCDQPTILTNFGVPWDGLFSRTPRFIHACGTCQRSLRDESVKDVDGWMAESLDAEARPDAEMVWGRRVKREAKT